MVIRWITALTIFVLLVVSATQLREASNGDY